MLVLNTYIGKVQKQQLLCIYCISHDYLMPIEFLYKLQFKCLECKFAQVKIRTITHVCSNTTGPLLSKLTYTQLFNLLTASSFFPPIYLYSIHFNKYFTVSNDISFRASVSDSSSPLKNLQMYLQNIIITCK